MGLSFHYSGEIKDIALIDDLVEEVKDIADCLAWKHRFFDDEVKGISVTADGCETLFLTFLPNGHLCSIINIVIGLQNYSPPYTVSVKTQFANADVHVTLIKLLQYIGKKYLENVVVYDEGGYWETNDKQHLLKKFEEYNTGLKAVVDALAGFKNSHNSTSDSLTEKLEDYLLRNMRKDV